jgi:hypothetical protein
MGPGGGRPGPLARERDRDGRRVDADHLNVPRPLDRASVVKRAPDWAGGEHPSSGEHHSRSVASAAMASEEAGALVMAR